MTMMTMTTFFGSYNWWWHSYVTLKFNVPFMTMTMTMFLLGSYNRWWHSFVTKFNVPFMMMMISWMQIVDLWPIMLLRGFLAVAVAIIIALVAKAP